MTLENKSCTVCLEVKPVSEFHKDRTTSDGRSFMCRVCKTARKRQRYAYMKANEPEKLRAQWKKNQLKSDYNMSPEEWDQMFAAQDFHCAICPSKVSQVKNRSMMIDHDHKTDKVRGLLCGHCNSLLGLAHDNVEILKSAIVYLENNSRTSSRQP